MSCARADGRVVSRLGACAVAALGAVGAMPAAAAQGLRIAPTVSVSETVTNNDIAAPHGRSEAITQLSAGLVAGMQSARTQASVDYALSALFHARDTGRNTSQNTLSASLRSEWYERQGFLTASASIRQGAVSAFGAQPGLSTLPSANVTEVRSLQAAPRWEGFLGPHLRFGVNAAAGLTDAKNTDTGDSSNSALGIRLSPARPGPLGWSVIASRNHSGFDAGKGSGSSRVFATASYPLIDLDLRLSGSAGWERSDVASSQGQSGTTYGLGFDWTPSPRTQVSVNWDRRAFGETYRLAASYRTPLTVWSLNGSRALTDTGSSLLAGARAALFNLYFSDPRFVALAADPVQRTALVEAFIDALPQSALSDAGFLRSSATLDQQASLSAAMRLQRGSVTVTHSRTNSRRADAGAAASDDLASSSNVRVRSSSVAWSHRLTPQMSATMLISQQSGAGQAASQSNDQRSYSLQFSGALGEGASWTLALRRVLHDAAVQAYGESVLTAKLAYRF